MRGGRGEWPGGRVEGVVGTLLIVELGSLGFFGKWYGGVVGRHNSTKKYGTTTNKISLQTKSGAGNTSRYDGVISIFTKLNLWALYRPWPTRR